MVEVLILADDFTGALDTAAQFTKRGISALVYPEDSDLDFKRIDPAIRVLSINMETRHKSGAEAYRHVKELTRQAIGAGVGKIYKKTDSALRGNIGSELQAVLDAAGGGQLLFLPAYPKSGRTTCRGVQYFNGVEIADSVFGRDPFEPVRYSQVARIIAEQSAVETVVIGKNQPLLRQEEGKSRVCIVDAVCNEDIIAFCGSIPSGSPVLLGGCAGFAEYLAAAMAEEGGGLRLPSLEAERIIVASGSLNPISRRQLERLKADGVPLFRIRPGGGGGERELAQICACLEEKQIVALQTEDRKEPAAVREGEENKDGTMRADRAALEARRQKIAAEFGSLIRRLAERQERCALVVIGGDTLRNVIRELFTGSVTPVNTVLTGVVASLARDKKGRQVILVSKSGGFGDENTLVEICRYLRRQSQWEEKDGKAGK